MGMRMVPPDCSISKKIEENLYSFYNIIAKTSGKTGYCGSDVNWVITKPSYWPNQIYGARLNKNNIEKRVREILETPLIKTTKPRWVIGPTSRPKELSVYLEKNGFQLQYECPGMAIDLRRVKENEPCNCTDLIIRMIDNEKMLRKAADIASITLFEGGDIAASLNKNLLMERNVKFYLGFVDGKAVASSILYFSNGIAGLYNVGVMEKYRNRGIGTAMTKATINDAKKAGYCIGVLDASNLGESVYRKIGFKEYCRIKYYQWV